jgi:hypothetical protein
MSIDVLARDLFCKGVKMKTQIRNESLAGNAIQRLESILAVSGPSTTAGRSLIQRAKWVRAVSLENGIPLRVLGVRPLFDQVRVVTQTTPNWALYNLSHDPLWQTGKFPIPRRHLGRLNQLYRTGVEFDVLYVAHELPVDFDPEVDPLELELFKPGPPRTVLQLAQRFGAITDGILSTYAAALRRPIQALTVAGLNSSSVLRDPILMGAVIPSGVNPEEGVPAVWFLLAAWRW